MLVFEWKDFFYFSHSFFRNHYYYYYYSKWSLYGFSIRSVSFFFHSLVQLISLIGTKHDYPHLKQFNWCTHKYLVSGAAKHLALVGEWCKREYIIIFANRLSVDGFFLLLFLIHSMLLLSIESAFVGTENISHYCALCIANEYEKNIKIRITLFKAN